MCFGQIPAARKYDGSIKQGFVFLVSQVVECYITTEMRKSTSQQLCFMLINYILTYTEKLSILMVLWRFKKVKRGRAKKKELLRK